MRFPDLIEKTEPTRLHLRRRVDFLIGGLVCAAAALGACFLAAGHPWEVFVPLVFSAVLLLTAMRFGARAGIAGTLLAAVIFAVFLFKPLGKLQVASETARANLVWMLLMGIVFSFLFAPPPSGVRRP
jgi:K+-sensing histidine kinase KdpD